MFYYRFHNGPSFLNKNNLSLLMLHEVFGEEVGGRETVIGKPADGILAEPVGSMARQNCRQLVGHAGKYSG
jgi:hypothetical protein